MVGVFSEGKTTDYFLLFSFGSIKPLITLIIQKKVLKKAIYKIKLPNNRKLIISGTNLMSIIPPKIIENK